MLPGEVKVGPVYYKVIVGDEHFITDDVRGAQAYADHEAGIIYMRDNLPDDLAVVLLMHEAHHCINAQNGVTHILGEKKEEDIVEMTDTWWVMFVQDNPHVIKEIYRVQRVRR